VSLRRALATGLVLSLVGPLVAPTAADAGERRVLVLPLSGSAPAAGTEAPRRFTQAVASAAALDGAEITVGEAPYEDVAALSGCKADDTACLAQVARSLHVDEVVVGTILPAGEDGAVTVRLTLYRDLAVTEHAIALAGGDLDVMSARLGRDAARIFGIPAPPEPVAVAVATAAVAPPPAATLVKPTAGAPQRGAERTWWIVAGSGAAAMATGVYFGWQARADQDEIDDAPTRTRQDVERLIALEERAGRNATIGNALLIGGTAALAVGGAVIITRALAIEADDALRISAVPLPGGGAVGLEVTLP
jgi:hypothetical protein